MTCIPNKFHIVEEKVPVLLMFLMSAMCFIKVLYIIETPIFFSALNQKIAFFNWLCYFWCSPWISPQITYFKVKFEPNILRKITYRIMLLLLLSSLFFSDTGSRMTQQCQHLTQYPRYAPSSLTGIFPSLLVYLFHILHIDKWMHHSPTGIFIVKIYFLHVPQIVFPEKLIACKIQPVLFVFVFVFFFFSRIKRLNIIKMSTLPKLICRLNVIPVRIPAGCFFFFFLLPLFLN